MEAVIQNIVTTYLIPGLVASGGPALLYVLSLVAKWVKAKTNSEHIDRAVDWLHALAANAVKEQEQLAVKKLKAEGKWNGDSQAKVKAKAKEVFLRHWGSDRMAEFRKLTGHDGEGGEAVVLGMVDTALEAAVSGMSSCFIEAIPETINDAPTAVLKD